MSADSVKLSELISHRFRGFSKHENTLDGLISALDFGVELLEFDVRMAACGTPIVYHDEFATDAHGDIYYLCDYKASSYQDLGGTFARMPTFEDLLTTVKNHGNSNYQLLVDIKDGGFEEEIHALISLHRVQDRCMYVSWLPDVLYELQRIAPDIPKCLSHWCQPVNATIEAMHKVYKSTDGNIPASEAGYTMGVRMGWEITAPIKGDMLRVLKASKGGVCVPQDMVTRSLCDYYHANGLLVSTFSYTNVRAIKSHKTDFGIDMYFIDNKKIFEELA